MNRLCQIKKPTEVLGDVWNLLIIEYLLPGPARFNEIKDGLDGLTSRTLSNRLKSLTSTGIIERTQYAQTPPRVDYTLTDMGVELKPVIEAIRKFGDKWMCN